MNNTRFSQNKSAGAKSTVTHTVRYAGKDVEKNARKYGRLAIRIMYLLQTGDEPFDIVLKVRPSRKTKRGAK